ncbi:MAG: rhomboid family intramembrane serine protease [Bacteroidales bacterium]|nr:rhomboid family intramembrane serine protease [Bacteroidales bacterium]
MTIAIIVLTTIVSVYAFNKPDFFYKLTLNPYFFFRNREYWRIVTHGFIHADWVHLGVNMFVLFSFGIFNERYLKELAVHDYIRHPSLNFLFLYAGGILFSALPTLYRHRNNVSYNSVGASGAVSAVVFTSIFFQPKSLIYFYFIPIPAFVFGILYLLYSQYMAKRSDQNINHEAHFAGALFGFLYPVLMNPALIRLFLSEMGLV